MYNERKMNGKEGIRAEEETALITGEDGHILATRNMPEGMTFIELFEQRKLQAMKMKRSGPRIKNESFHMSVNPSEEDKKLSDQEAVDLIDEIMECLGYAKQPYRIYKHTDIERHHYHVVSTRVDENGKKISDSFERLVLRNKLKELGKKYGFTLVLNEQEIQKEENEENKDNTQKPLFNKKEELTTNTNNKESVQNYKKGAVPPFMRRSKITVTQQFKDCVEDALKWNFTSFEQFQAILIRRYHIMADVERSTNKILLYGTDEDAVTVSVPLSENLVCPDLANKIAQRAEQSKKHMRKKEWGRLNQIVALSAKLATDYDHFNKLLEKKGIILAISWSKDGKPFGVTYFDKMTLCAWKGSDTKVDLQWLLDVAEKKGWTLTKDKFQKTLDRRNNAPSRKPTPEVRKKTDFGKVAPGNNNTSSANGGPGLHIANGNTVGSHEEFNQKGDKLFDDDKDEGKTKLIQS